MRHIFWYILWMFSGKKVQRSGSAFDQLATPGLEVLSTPPLFHPLQTPASCGTALPQVDKSENGEFWADKLQDLRANVYWSYLIFIVHHSVTTLRFVLVVLPSLAAMKIAVRVRTCFCWLSLRPWWVAVDLRTIRSTQNSAIYISFSSYVCFLQIFIYIYTENIPNM